MEKNIFFIEGELVGVLTTEPINRFLDYYAPIGGVSVGDFVEVNLGPRKVIGCVWSKGSGEYDSAKIKQINRVLDITPMKQEMRSFLCRVSNYTLSPLSGMLRLALRGNSLLYKPATRKVHFLSKDYKLKFVRKTVLRLQVVNYLKQQLGKSFSLKELILFTGVSRSVIKGLIDNQVLVEKTIFVDLSFPKLTIGPTRKKLSAEQLLIAKKLKLTVRNKIYTTTLLKGVTGSGKTEVYLEAVAECLNNGDQVLVLLPEIALTSTFIDRVEERFDSRPAEWHSGISKTEKNRCWKMVASGNAKLVVGARSALYLPFKNLKLIVVDEEHDSSYKQARRWNLIQCSGYGCA